MLSIWIAIWVLLGGQRPRQFEITKEAGKPSNEPGPAMIFDQLRHSEAQSGEVAGAGAASEVDQRITDASSSSLLR